MITRPIGAKSTLPEQHIWSSLSFMALGVCGRNVSPGSIDDVTALHSSACWSSHCTALTSADRGWFSLLAPTSTGLLVSIENADCEAIQLRNEETVVSSQLLSFCRHVCVTAGVEAGEEAHSQTACSQSCVITEQSDSLSRHLSCFQYHSYESKYFD